MWSPASQRSTEQEQNAAATGFLEAVVGAIDRAPERTPIEQFRRAPMSAQ